MFRGSGVACTLSDFFGGCRGNSVDGVARSEVRFDLLLGPSCFEWRDKIGRTDHVFSQTAKQFDRPAIDQRDCKDDVIRRILHRDVAIRREHRLQGVEQFLPSGILALAAGQGIKMASFNLMYQLDWFTLL